MLVAIYTHSIHATKPYSLIICHKTIRIWQSRKHFTTLNFANASQNKTFTKSCQDWTLLLFTKVSSAPPSMKYHQNWLSLIWKTRTQSYPNVWNPPESILQNWTGGDFEKSGRNCFFETHCICGILSIYSFVYLFIYIHQSSSFLNDL